MSRDIPLSLIDRDPSQPRQHFDETSLNELAQSIAATGLASPIMVRPVGERYLIVHGERRFRAVSMLGWATIPAEVRDIDADAAGWLTLVENIQRADLSPIEEAHAYQERLAHSMTQAELGQRIGKTQDYIATKLRLLKLPKLTQAMIHYRKLSEGHAKQLLRLNSPAAQFIFTCVIVHDAPSVKQVNERITRLLDEEPQRLKKIDEAWGFIEEWKKAPDDSALVQKYGRISSIGWDANGAEPDLQTFHEVIGMLLTVHVVVEYAFGRQLDE